jgi:putative oxidoreductase
MSPFKFVFYKGIQLSLPAIRFLDFVSPAIDLAARLWVAHVFWKAGQLKIASWSSTLYMFQYEYQVPLLPPEIAAVLAAGVELGGSILLALGLGGRFAATALFVLNFLAVISYPDLSPAGRTEHLYWGFLLLFFIVRGPGRISLDHHARKRFMADEPSNHSSKSFIKNPALSLIK